ncbi:Uu.00g106330.m01.CDS01 [Anthostomella pinea]|uniref:Uu.00g106330.m01.CDS01 n=1 Tax=Anthostomella pinea TaxID=933095 RepID=A0AAI8YFW5_9PEZI|nr:Uu.00g106330.m01.CDS01 [Anthostomella pinea]
MPATKQQRRKALAKPEVTTTQQHASSSISSFTRVSKTVGSSIVKKDLVSLTPKKDIKIEAITLASRKRKAIATIEDDSSADERPSKLALPSIPSLAAVQPAKRGRGRPKKARPEPTPRKRARSPSVSDSDVSAIDAGSLFKKLRLESSPSRCSSPLTANTSVADSDIDADIEFSKPDQLPSEVLSLIDLHTAFLKTLTLHYAHNGSNIPADLRILCPNVARAWGKKRVTDAEIRVCIGVLNSHSSSQSNASRSNNLLSLSNYGRGKICIEIDPAHGSGPLNEKKLNDLFRDNLEALWSLFTANGKPDAAAFMTSLPKAPVTVCESVVKASPILLKGQRRLEDLKHGIAVKKQEKETKPQGNVPMTNADGSKMSLLDRIRYKSLQKSAMPAGLTPARLERRAALQRIDDVAAMIGMLSRATSAGQGRISFTMVAMLEKLKDSFRMGISKEEGAVCVRLLGSEVAPEWIRVVTIGQRENVVIETDCQLSKVEIANRVQAVLARV